MGMTIVDYVTRDLLNEPGAPELMRQMVHDGKLGAKTGQGFYDWSAKSADDVRARRDAFLVEVLRYRRSRSQE
jgi:3-hydroxybutyryl-CoA dehydrogenase